MALTKEAVGRGWFLMGRAPSWLFGSVFLIPARAFVELCGAAVKISFGDRYLGLPCNSLKALRIVVAGSGDASGQG